MLKLLGECRIRGFEHNLEVEGSDGRTYYLDFGNKELMLAVECDSKEFHSTKAEKAQDAERQRILEEAGWVFQRFSSEQILKQPEEVKKGLRLAVEKTVKSRKNRLTP
jgi:very-short-patch-repair endonuclease